MFENAFNGRRVLVTGHTGFKGCWLSLWLNMLGADVAGVALEPETEPNLFESADLGQLVSHAIVDIRDAERLAAHVQDFDPEIIFHLAAQPLVRRSYDRPLETIATNVLGTANVLETGRSTSATRAIVCVTTDKVYQDRGWPWPYRESDTLGGKDPYSASKAAAEIIVSSYRQSMMANGNGAAVATARGGNVIGGGDWSDDRLIPDVVRAIQAGTPLRIRNPKSTRPWQHVLALCHGYLALAEALLREPEKYAGAWNFGPGHNGVISVEELLWSFGQAWQLPEIETQPSHDKPETALLALDSNQVEFELGWKSPWQLNEAVEFTARWYRDFGQNEAGALTLMRDQINVYQRAMGTM